MTKTTPDCCEVWPRLRDHFAWFEFEDEPNCFAMPSLISDGIYWRINHCPSCGAERRAAIWNRNDELQASADVSGVEVLSPTAQAVLDAFRTNHTGQGCLAAALRAAADQCAEGATHWELYAIAAELEATSQFGES